MKIKNLFRRILTIVILLLIFVIVMKLTETERTEPVLENLKIERILTPYNFEDCNNTKRIKYIVVHYFGDLATAEEVANYYYSYSVDVSALIVLMEAMLSTNVLKTVTFPGIAAIAA